MAKKKVVFHDVIQVVDNKPSGDGGGHGDTSSPISNINVTGGGIGSIPRVTHDVEETQDQKDQSQRIEKEKREILSNAKESAVKDLINSYAFLTEDEMKGLNRKIKGAGSVGEINQIKKEMQEDKIRFQDLGSKMEGIRKIMHRKKQDIHKEYVEDISRTMNKVETDIYDEPFPYGYIINQRYPVAHVEERQPLSNPYGQGNMTIKDVVSFNGAIRDKYTYQYFFEIYEENGTKNGRWIEARIIRQNARDDIHGKEKIILEVIGANGQLDAVSSGIRTKQDIISPAELREYGYTYLDKLTHSKRKNLVAQAEKYAREKYSGDEHRFNDFIDINGNVVQNPMTIQDALESGDENLIVQGREKAENLYMQANPEIHQEVLDIKEATNKMQDIRGSYSDKYHKAGDNELKKHLGTNKIISIKEKLEKEGLTHMDDLNVSEGEVKKYSKEHKKEKLIGEIIEEGNWFIVTYESLFEELADVEHDNINKVMNFAEQKTRGARNAVSKMRHPLRKEVLVEPTDEEDNT